MKNLVISIVIILLASIAIMQFLAAKNIYPKRELQIVCPVDAITMQAGKAVIDSVKCVGCRRCVDGVSAFIIKAEDSADTRQTDDANALE